MESRTSKSFVNIFFGLGQQFFSIIFSFITRTVFIHYLSKELLGVNSLFANVLSILSLADLGLDTAMIYSLYKPLSEKNEQKLSALVNYFRKLYLGVAGIIFVLGIILMPFLRFLIGENTNINGLYIYYLIFLIDTCISYTLANRFAIVNADQKSYIIKKYTLFFNALKCFLQCLSLILFKSFLLYLIIQVLTTFLLNFVCAKKAKKLYPFIKKEEALSKTDKKEIFANIKSLIFYKIGGVVFANSDNILISAMLGVIMVGIYTNYLTLINAVNNIITIAFTAVSFSVGNLIAKESKKQQYAVFKKLNFFSLFLFGIATVCFVVLLNDFVYLWIGTDFLLNMNVVVVIAINFYMQGILRPIWVYRDSAGLFKQVQFLPLVTSALNIVFSIILGLKFGLFGILGATVIARVLSNFWYEPYILTKLYFKNGFIDYMKKLLKNIIIISICSIIFIYINSLVFSYNWTSMFLMAIITFVGTLIIFIVLYHKEEEFLFFKSLIIEITQKVYEKVLKKGK